jgi:hypothetical protein
MPVATADSSHLSTESRLSGSTLFSSARPPRGSHHAFMNSQTTA